MKYCSTVKIGLTLIFFMTLPLAFGACEPSLTIIVSNQTNEPLRIYHGGEVFVGEAIPGGEVTYKTWGNLSQYNVQAKDNDRNTVYSVNFTSDDVKGKRMHRIVVPPTGKAWNRVKMSPGNS